MSWIDVVFLALLTGLSFLGFKKGIIHVAVVMVSYIAGIAAAAALAGPAGALIAHYLKIPGGPSVIIGAVLVFIITAISVRGAGLLLKKLAALVLPGMDKACGLAFGFIFAAGLSALASVFLYVSPPDSAPGRLYDASLTPRFIIKTLERAWPGGNGPRESDFPETAGAAGPESYSPEL